MPHPTSSRLSSLALREVADFAASLRPRDGTEPVEEYIVTRFDEKKGDWRMKRHRGGPPPAGTTGVAVPVDTWTVQPDRPRVKHVSMQVAGIGDVSLDRFDAVFWSEAAVEKFVLGYYASKYQWAAAHVLTKISEAFYGYVPNPADDNRPGSAKREKAEGHETYPFAIGHLPRSDYATLDESGIGDELHFLFPGTDGKITSRPLSEFL